MNTDWIPQYAVHIAVALGVWVVAFYLLGKDTRRRLLRPARVTVHPRSVVDAERREAIAPVSVVSGRHFEVFYSMLNESTVTYKNLDNNEIFFVICGEASAQVYTKDDELVVDKVIRAHGCSASEHGEDLVAHALEGQYIRLTGTMRGTRILCLVVPPYSEMMRIVGTLERAPGEV